MFSQLRKRTLNTVAKLPTYQTQCISRSIDTVISSGVAAGTLYYSADYRRGTSAEAELVTITGCIVGSALIGLAAGAAVRQAAILAKMKLAVNRVLPLSYCGVVTMVGLQFIPICVAIDVVPTALDDMEVSSFGEYDSTKRQVVEASCIVGFTVVGMTALAAMGLLPVAAKARIIRRVITKM
jgi:hypothetical protein